MSQEQALIERLQEWQANYRVLEQDRDFWRQLSESLQAQVDRLKSDPSRNIALGKL